MNPETKVCQNCKNQFTIEPDDFAFYEKVNVPSPTFCPECRKQKRLTWRNERVLYRGTCELCGRHMVSMYSQDSGVKIYCQQCWYSDNWDSLGFGREYDFSKSFFEQFGSLYRNVPILGLNNIKAENSEYCNHTYETKNCYLNFASDMNEDSAYLYHTIQSKNSYDLFGCKNQELCYQGLYSHDCYKNAFTYFSKNCVDCAFMFNCNNCKSCFGCVNLRNATNCIFNVKYSKEDYEKEMEKYDLGSHGGLEEIADGFNALALKFPKKFAQLIQAVKSVGDYLYNAKNCQFCFDIEGPVEDSKYIIYGIPNIKNCYDIYGTGAGAELCYEILGCGLSLQNVAFSVAYNSHSLRYSLFCHDSHNLFACIGLRSKQYCILNKQYTKEEYESLVPRIIKHMSDMPYVDQKGRIYRYGEFFPPELSPFAYNETIAQEYFPLTKAEAIEQGYRWKDPDTKEYQVTLLPAKLPDHIRDVKDDILKETIGCAHEGRCTHQCTTAFRIIPEELSFYRRMNLPLPRLCPNCRHYERLAQRNPLKLWYRRCQCVGEKSENGIYQNTVQHQHGAGKCLNEFETSYAPERKEIIYCDGCYQAEVA